MVSQRAAVAVFDEAYSEKTVLKDRTPVTLRLVRPGDKQLLLEAWERLSPESRYRRFLSPKRILTGEELRYLTELDHVDHLAIGAALDSGGKTHGLGVARFVRLAGRPDAADVAVTVVDDAQRNGLGRLLLSRLIAAARERGIERFVCDVLATNHAMRALIRSLVPAAAMSFDGPTFRVEMPLGRVGSSTWPGRRRPGGGSSNATGAELVTCGLRRS